MLLLRILQDTLYKGEKKQGALNLNLYFPLNKDDDEYAVKCWNLERGIDAKLSGQRPPKDEITLDELLRETEDTDLIKQDSSGDVIELENDTEEECQLIVGIRVWKVRWAYFTLLYFTLLYFTLLLPYLYL